MSGIEIQSLTFTGRADPRWRITGRPAQEVLELLKKNPDTIASPKTILHPLWRGLHLRLPAGEARQAGIPPSVIVTPQACNRNAALKVSERILASAEARTTEIMDGGGRVPLNRGTMKLLRHHLEVAATARDIPALCLSGGGNKSMIRHKTDRGPCYIELGSFEPDRWNSDAVRPFNNCYCYAANRPVMRICWPGAGSGYRLPDRFTADDMARALRLDGAVPSNECLPATDAPRWEVYLILISDGMAKGWSDFHFIRRHRGNPKGFWAGKGGGYYALRCDHRGNIIENAEKAEWLYRMWIGCGYWVLPEKRMKLGYIGSDNKPHAARSRRN